MSNTNLTKKELAESLKRLASERLFEHITVGDFVKECGVNRQTFYYHFTDKYELLDWIYNNETFMPLTADISFENWDEKLLELFRIMKRNRSFYMNTIKCSNNYFEEYLQKMLATLFRIAIDDLDVNNQVEEIQKNLHAKIFAYGLTGTIIEWAMNGMKEDEEKMTYYIKALTVNVENLAYQVHTFKENMGIEVEKKGDIDFTDVDFTEIISETKKSLEAEVE